MPSVLQRAIEAPQIVKALRTYGVTQNDVASVAGVTDRAVRGRTTSEIRPQRYDRLADLRDLAVSTARTRGHETISCSSWRPSHRRGSELERVRRHRALDQDVPAAHQQR
jgi:hypothetical protein